jgi:hypothetical protein
LLIFYEEAIWPVFLAPLTFCAACTDHAETRSLRDSALRR